MGEHLRGGLRHRPSGHPVVRLVLPRLEMTQMSISQSVECPLTSQDTVVLTGQLQSRHGHASGSIGTTLRRVVSHNTCLEASVCGMTCRIPTPRPAAHGHPLTHPYPFPHPCPCPPTPHPFPCLPMPLPILCPPLPTPLPLSTHPSPVPLFTPSLAPSDVHPSHPSLTYHWFAPDR